MPNVVFRQGEVRICLASADEQYLKYVPLRHIQLHNPRFLGSSLTWHSEPHLSTTRRQRWLLWWRDGLHWHRRAIALLYTFGDDIASHICLF